MLCCQSIETRVAKRIFEASMRCKLAEAPLKDASCLTPEFYKARINRLWKYREQSRMNEYRVIARVILEKAFNWEFLHDMRGAQKGGNISAMSLYADATMPSILYSNPILYRNMLINPKAYLLEVNRCLRRMWKKEHWRVKEKYSKGARLLQTAYTSEIERGNHSHVVPTTTRIEGWSRGNPFYHILLPKKAMLHKKQVTRMVE